ncbi:hypothetical protein PR202_gb28746 [Eleusine coracana subsp. coracana]|uniref:Band 7 domain-containing protein n=1 Tax=Eleusine coracana subsp. coracana TaxID=191504 RepID=A0AAV5FZN0_ELECO|nr:hypothetical protein PR202_gb28746 [Eleusine coracana subsp. coracana]
MMSAIHHVLILQIMDPYLASYSVENPIYEVLQLAKTTTRSEYGKTTLNNMFEDRDTVNEKIVTIINEGATDWGLKCLRYEIRNITPPEEIRAALTDAEAEKKWCAQILAAEARRGK